jgi:hypothetical protein
MAIHHIEHPPHQQSAVEASTRVGIAAHSFLACILVILLGSIVVGIVGGIVDGVKR